MIYILSLLDPRPRPEGSYIIGSVRPSFRQSIHLSVSFLVIDALVFSETLHGVRGRYIVVCDRAGFFGKNPYLKGINFSGNLFSRNINVQ